MEIKQRKRDNVIILRVLGKILIGDGDVKLYNAITPLLKNRRVKILLDLQGCPSVCSGGLGELIRCYTRVTRNGGELKFCRLRKRMRDLMATTDLASVFEIYNKQAEAIASFT